MPDIVYNASAIGLAAATNRWAALTKIDVDVATLGTWDTRLPRRKRVLVPIDVQAMVVPAAAPEPTVAVAGMRDDPEPFAAPVTRAGGVHLHWALPDALLRGTHVDGATSVTLPPLPDRWVVIRTLLPVDGRVVHARGWVVDSAKGSVTPLNEYAGTTMDAPDGVPVFVPLDGSSGGTLLWTATYEGAKNRFALHDDLADLPALRALAPKGFHGGRACYTVAGWWSDAAADPIASARGRLGLEAELRSLGWYVSAEAPDEADEGIDPATARLDAAAKPSPPTATPTYTVSTYAKSVATYTDLAPMVAPPVSDAAAYYIGITATRYQSLLHGSVLGVPVTGAISATDDRPAGGSIGSSIGLDLDDVTAAMAAPSFGVTAERRQAAERLMAAFTSDMLSRIATPDGVRDVEEHEHADGFWAFNGAPLAGAKDDRLRAEDSVPLGPTAVGRKGRAAARPAPQFGVLELQSEVAWRGGAVFVKGGSSAAAAKPATPSQVAPPPGSPGSSRSVKKPPPRLFRPAPPIIGLRGLRPNARHHGDGLFDGLGLRCRFPGECKPGFQGTVDVNAILPTLGSGAIPVEVLTVVREAVTFDPYASQWLARAGAPEPQWGAREVRIAAEHIRLFGGALTYDGSGQTAAISAMRGPRADGSTWAMATTEISHAAAGVAQELAGFSLLEGAPPSPIAISTWRQPWVPLMVEWRVRVDGGDTLDGWVLDGLDLGRDAASPPVAATIQRELTGRSPLSTGIARSLTQAIDAWLLAEAARDMAIPSQSQLSRADEAALATLRDLVAIDLVSLSMDGIRAQLLGIDYLGGHVIREAPADPPGGPHLPTASGLPTPMFGGTIEVLELRAIDAFGRLLDIPVGTMRTTQTLEVLDRPATIDVHPRLQHGARWLFRLVDPGADLGSDPLGSPEAYVDQLAGDAAITPVAGYLLPDHMDESLEVFDRFGHPIGEVLHDSISDAVTFEPAPGRAVPPDAGPLTGIPAEFGAPAQHVALLAAGLIRRDVETRHSGQPAARSALSALLRVIDTTLWSIDTFQSIGTPTIAGLVGRPVAVVRATLRLEAPDDLAEVRITEVGGGPARAKAFGALEAQRFPVRLGDLGRSDDSLLGFFVDDNYSRFHVVDKVVASLARDSGRHRGYLGLLGDVGLPGPDPIEHPYIELEDTLHVLPGQVLRLTLLMLPAGKVHLTSGILPRKSLALADDWVTPGLRRLVPSLRVGPVLVDPAEIRMPLVASLGENQQFVRRTGPLTWKEDPIVAATSAAMLPRMPHEAQEGWIRVAPVTDGGQP